MCEITNIAHRRVWGLWDHRNTARWDFIHPITALAKQSTPQHRKAPCLPRDCERVRDVTRNITVFRTKTFCLAQIKHLKNSGKKNVKPNLPQRLILSFPYTFQHLNNQFVIKLQLKKLKNQLLNFLSTLAGNRRPKNAFLILRTVLALGRTVK